MWGSKYENHRNYPRCIAASIMRLILSGEAQEARRTLCASRLTSYFYTICGYASSWVIRSINMTYALRSRCATATIGRTKPPWNKGHFGLVQYARLKLVIKSLRCLFMGAIVLSIHMTILTFTCLLYSGFSATTIGSVMPPNTLGTLSVHNARYFIAVLSKCFTRSSLTIERIKTTFTLSTYESAAWDALCQSRSDSRYEMLHTRVKLNNRHKSPIGFRSMALTETYKNRLRQRTTNKCFA